MKRDSFAKTKKDYKFISKRETNKMKESKDKTIIDLAAALNPTDIMNTQPEIVMLELFPPNTNEKDKMVSKRKSINKQATYIDVLQLYFRPQVD